MVWWAKGMPGNEDVSSGICGSLCDVVPIFEMRTCTVNRPNVRGGSRKAPGLDGGFGFEVDVTGQESKGCYSGMVEDCFG
jgi:hypothetical protein